LIASLDFDPGMMEDEEREEVESEMKEQEINAQEKLRQFFVNNPETEAKCIFFIFYKLK
jgi:hypothetical protein